MILGNGIVGGILLIILISDIKDQGLTRPKVLILVPFRDSALKIVSAMMSIAVKPGKVLL